MKTVATLCLLLGVLAPARAQVFRPHGTHGHSGWSHHRAHGWSARPVVSFRYSDYGWRTSPWSYGYSSYPVYTSGDYLSTSRVGAGLFWGGLLGAIVGNNSGSLDHNAWRGAAYGAAAGALLGVVGDSVAARERPESVAASSTATYPPSFAEPSRAAATDAPAENGRPVTAPARASKMSSANALFGR